MRIAVVLSAFLTLAAGAPAVAQDMTEAECRKKFLEVPDKDWRGYDECRRAATQLRVKGGEPQALPLPNDTTQPQPPAPSDGGGR